MTSQLDLFPTPIRTPNQRPLDPVARAPLFVVPCSQTKNPMLIRESLPARDAYAGQAFRMARSILEERQLRWCILSGWYGFLWPDTRIEYYEQKMEPVTADTVWHDCFGHITNHQYGQLMTYARTPELRVVVLGSRLYVDAAAALLQRPVESPIAGLPIGRMLSALRQGAWSGTEN